MHNSLRNFSYLFYSEDPKYSEVYCVDPFDPDLILEYLQKNQLKLTKIINTHQHHDHIRGNEKLSQEMGAEVLALFGDEKIKLDEEWELEVLATPGHTPEHIGLLLKQNGKEKILFSGDTLFNCGVGNCKHGGNVDVLYKTFSEIYSKLPGDIIVYTGHDYYENNKSFAAQLGCSDESFKELNFNDGYILTTLSEERKMNPFLRLDSPDIRKNLVAQNLISDITCSDKEVFLAMRKLRDSW